MTESGKERQVATEPSCDVVDGISFQDGNRRQSEDRAEQRIKGLINLHRDVTTSVTDIQVAADAKVLSQQAEVEKEHKIWGTRLEDDSKSTREKCEEISTRWSLVNETMIAQELQKTKDGQQQLYAAIIEEKKKLIDDLLKVLKIGDNSYLEILKKNTEEIELMEEKMKDGRKSLTKAYREELSVTETFQLQEFKALLSEKRKLDDDLVKLWEQELERLKNRQKTMKEHEEGINKKIWDCFNITNIARMESVAEQQAYERRQQQIKEFNLMSKMTLVQQEHQDQIYSGSLLSKEQEILSLQAEMKNLKLKNEAKMEGLSKKRQLLAEEHKRCLQQYERTLRKVKHLNSADANQIVEVWHTTDGEVKQHVERALKIDSMICKDHLGLPWKRPSLASALVPPQNVLLPEAAQTAAFQAEMEASAGALLDHHSQVGMYTDEEEMTDEAQKAVIKLFCDEAGFLVEEKLLKLLKHLGEEELPGLKLDLLLSELGFKNEDVPKLIRLLWMYSKVSEAVVVGAPHDVAESAAFHANDVLPALKRFLEQRRRISAAHRQAASWHKRVQKVSEGIAYWEKLTTNVISEEKLKLLEAAESLFLKYLTSLTELSNLVAEVEIQKQLKTELWDLLHPHLMD